MTKMVAMAINSKNLKVKNLLLQSQKAYDFETWYEASGNGALQSLYKSCPWDALDLFIARSAWVAHAFEWGKLLQCHLKGKTCSELANGLNLYDLKKNDSRGCSDPVLGLYTCILPF